MSLGEVCFELITLADVATVNIIMSALDLCNVILPSPALDGQTLFAKAHPIFKVTLDQGELIKREAEAI